MKKKIILFYLFLIIGVSLFCVKTIYADDLIIEHWPSPITDAILYPPSTNWISQSFSTDNNFTISQITLRLKRVESYVGSYVYLGLYNGTSYVASSTNQILFNDIDDSASWPNWQEYDFYFNDYEIETGNTYWIRIIVDPNFDDPARIMTQRTTSDTYADGCYTGGAGGTWPTCATGGNEGDVLFNIYGSSNSVAITFPENEATDVGNFGLWQGNYNIAQTLNYGAIRVRYGYSTSSLIYSDYEPIVSQTGNFSINRMTDLASSTPVYAYAQLWNNNVEVASSTIITFQLESAEGDKIFPIYPYSPISTSSESVFRNKFPFAYFYDISDLINNYSNTDENNFFEFSLALFPDTQYSTSTSLISSSTLIEAIGQDNIDLIKVALKYVLWGGWVLMVYNTSKNLFKK
jgi:hypothetical protein